MRTIGRCNKRSSNTQKQHEAVAFGALNASSLLYAASSNLVSVLAHFCVAHYSNACYHFMWFCSLVRSNASVCVLFCRFREMGKQLRCVVFVNAVASIPIFCFVFFCFDFFCFVIIYLNATRERASCGRLYKLWINK